MTRDHKTSTSVFGALHINMGPAEAPRSQTTVTAKTALAVEATSRFPARVFTHRVAASPTDLAITGIMVRVLDCQPDRPPSFPRIHAVLRVIACGPVLTSSLNLTTAFRRCSLHMPDVAYGAIDLVTERATITVQATGTLSTQSFSTEYGYDYLTIDGSSYTGSRGPSGVPVRAGKTIYWRTDSSATYSGFTVCLSGTTSVKPDCADEQNAKCKANKAFIVLGVLFNAGAMGLVNVGAGASAAAASFAGLCYMIVFSIYADQFNTPVADCGFGGDENELMELGAAFGCTIAAWLLCWLGACIEIVEMMMSDDNDLDGACSPCDDRCDGFNQIGLRVFIMFLMASLIGTGFGIAEMASEDATTETIQFGVLGIAAAWLIVIQVASYFLRSETESLPFIIEM